MPFRDFNVLDAANPAADMVNALIDRSPRGWLLHVRQMRDSVQSIGANISEGFGRGAGRDRARSKSLAERPRKRSGTWLRPSAPAESTRETIGQSTTSSSRS